jgi:hypothetical protein
MLFLRIFETESTVLYILLLYSAPHSLSIGSSAPTSRTVWVGRKTRVQKVGHSFGNCVLGVRGRIMYWIGGPHFLYPIDTFHILHYKNPLLRRAFKQWQQWHVTRLDRFPYGTYLVRNCSDKVFEVIGSVALGGDAGNGAYLKLVYPTFGAISEMRSRVENLGL